MLDSFTSKGIGFYLFDPLQKEHMEFINEFEDDELIYNYYSGWKSILKDFLEKNTYEKIYVYIAQKDEDFVGICTLVYNDVNTVVYKQGILSKYGDEVKDEVRDAMINKMEREHIETMVEYFFVQNINDYENLVKKNYKLNNVGDSGFFEATHLESNQRTK